MQHQWCHTIFRYHVGKKKYPSMKTYATIKSALHAYTDTLCNSELSCDPQTLYSTTLSREKKPTVIEVDNTLHRPPLDTFHKPLNDRSEKATELKPKGTPTAGNVSETIQNCPQTAQETCYSSCRLPLTKDKPLETYTTLTEIKNTLQPNFIHSPYKTIGNVSSQRSGVLLPESLETKHIPSYTPNYSSLREIKNLQQLPYTTKPAYYPQFDRFHNMPQTTIFNNQRTACRSIVTQNHPKQKNITNGFWSNVAQHFFPLK
jgi:hypothetical protein